MKLSTKKTLNWINSSFLILSLLIFLYTIISFQNSEINLEISGMNIFLSTIISQIIIYGTLIEIICLYVISYKKTKINNKKKYKNFFWYKNVQMSLLTQDSYEKRIAQKFLYKNLLLLFLLLILSSAELFTYYGVSWDENNGYTSPIVWNSTLIIAIIEFIIALLFGFAVCFMFPAITIESRMIFEKSKTYKNEVKKLTNNVLRKMSKKQLKQAKYMKYISKKHIKN